MPEYTPGPWQVDGGGWAIVGSHGKYIAVMYGNDQREANANLIAAAPEMYEALKNLIYTSEKLWDMVKPIKDTDAIKAVHPIIERAKIVLAKAEGKQKTGD